MIIVLFKEDGTHELVESKYGITIETNEMVKENITRIYFAKSQQDATFAIQQFGK